MGIWGTKGHHVTLEHCNGSDPFECGIEVWAELDLPGLT